MTHPLIGSSTASGTTSAESTGDGMSSAPFASVTPGCHSRKASGGRGATTTGRGVNAARLRSVLATWRASCSPLIGQQKARRQRARPGNARSSAASIRRRQASRTGGASASRAAMSRSDRKSAVEEEKEEVRQGRTIEDEKLEDERKREKK